MISTNTVEKPVIHRQGNEGVVTHGKSAYTFEISAQDRSELADKVHQNRYESAWEDYPVIIGDFTVFPFGYTNNLPAEIRQTVGANHLLPRIQTKQKMLTWGKGPHLYKEKIEDGKIVTEYIEHAEIQQWLEDNDYETYLRKVMTDFFSLKLCWSKIGLRKSARLANPSQPIATFEHISAAKAREGNRTNDRYAVTHSIIGEWDELWRRKFQVYPIKNWRRPLSQKWATHCHKMFSFDTDHYTRPEVIGLMPWLRRSSAIPHILEALSDNSLNIKWHIISPQAYWDAIAEKLKEEYKMKDEPYDSSVLEKHKDEKFEALAQVLAGEKNVGKFFTSEKVIEVLGNQVVEYEWKIIPIDQKVKEYVTAQLDISKRADHVIVGGSGLHQALSNVSSDGKSDSGSEQLYAHQNFRLIEVDIPEAIICETINKCIAVNWPNSRIKIGFYRTLPQREEDKTPKDRVKNA